MFITFGMGQKTCYYAYIPYITVEELSMISSDLGYQVPGPTRVAHRQLRSSSKVVPHILELLAEPHLPRPALRQLCVALARSCVALCGGTRDGLAVRNLAETGGFLRIS